MLVALLSTSLMCSSKVSLCIMVVYHQIHLNTKVFCYKIALKYLQACSWRINVPRAKYTTCLLSRYITAISTLNLPFFVCCKVFCQGDMANGFAQIAKSPGDCVECMANSDNVVRAGLTPKLIDTPTLVRQE